MELEGTILCYDPGWGQLYVHDGANAIYLNPRCFTNQFQVGQRVRIHGTTTWDGAVPILTNATAVITGRQPLPRAASLRLAELGKSHGQWVEVRARVRVAEASRERVTLVLQEGDQNCLVYVMQTSSTNRFRELVDCEVNIQGINASRTRNGALEAGILFCPGLGQATVVGPRHENRWQLPVTPIETLLTRELGSWTNQPVHIAGLVSAVRPGESVTIKDPTGVLGAEVIQVTPLQVYQRVDLWGFLTTRTNGIVLADGYFEVVNRSTTDTLAKAEPIPESTNEAPLTEIKQVRSLSKQRANQHLPARVRGVLTFVDPDWHLAFLQDAKEPIFLDSAQSDLRPGQYVEVTGQTDGTGFAPQLINCSTKILGTTNWPDAIKADLQDAANGHLDSRWVELEGVVRRVHKESGRISLALAGSGGKFTATVLDFSTNSAPTELVDSLITLRGACGSTVNSRGQMSGISLHVPSRDEISPIDPSPADPFAMEPTLISRVATFDPARLAGRRIRVTGVVTLAAPDQGLFLQDASGGIRIVLDGTDRFRPGERLDVLAFPAMRDFSPCLEEATIRRNGATNLPTAKATSAARILQDGVHDGMRIELRAQVLQSHLQAAQPRLLLQDGPIIFTAHIVQPGKQRGIPNLNSGSVVKLRGVCVIQGTENNEPASFRLLLAGPEELRLIQSGPWWTTKHTMMLLASVGLGGMVVFAWVWSMRRQIRTQTEIIRQNQQELLETSRQAGMAEVATSVLHNVGNVLNSVNVSATLVSDQIRRSRLTDVSRIAAMLREHATDLGEFLARDAKGRHVPPYLERLGEHLAREQSSYLGELATLRKNIDHIKEIVAMQQSFGKVSGVTEKIEVTDLVEDALRLNEAALERHRIQVRRDYQSRLPVITVERHKVLQILVNLIANAKNACDEPDLNDRRLTLAVRNGGSRISISIADNGVGIAHENLTRIFNLGFTTRKNGHGFGLHSGALAAKELGGQLLAHSDGPGQGAIFTLELPLSPRDV